MVRFALSTTLVACIAVAAGAEPPAVGHDQPMLIIPAPGNDAVDNLAHADAVAEAWAGVPEPIRSGSRLLLETPATENTLYADRFDAVMREVQFRRIPVILHVAAGGPERASPVETIQQWLDTYSEIQGVLVSGFTVNDYAAWAPDEPRWMLPAFRWLTDALRVTANADRYFLLEMGGLEWPRLVSHVWAEEFLDAMEVHSNNVLTLADPRGHGQFARVGSLMGLWMEGKAANWGMRISGDWYAAAHFASPGVFGDAANTVPMPASLYRAQMLTAASGGAAVFRFDEPDILWGGTRRDVWEETLQPTITELVQLGAIARKDWLIRNTHVAFRLNAAASPLEFHRNLTDIDGVLAEGFMIHGAYGMERPGQVPELIPNTDRYRWIPILSPGASDENLSLFEEVVLPGAMLDARSWTERLDLYYPEEGEGEAFVARVGRAVYVMHTRENHYAPQTFRVPKLPAPVSGVRAERTPEGIRLSWPFREGDLSYRVHRRLPDETRFRMIARDIEGRNFVDEAFANPEVAYYAVTALTQETEPMIGTVNYGDYRLYSSVESRIEDVVEIRSFETRAQSQRKPATTIDDRSTEVASANPFADDVDPRRRDAGRMAIDLLERLEGAYRAEDTEALLELYADSYSDTFLRDKDRIRLEYNLFFAKYRTGPVHWQVRSGDVEADGRFRVQCHLWFTAAEPVDGSGRFGDRFVAFPDARPRDLEIVFVSEPDAATGVERMRIESVNQPIPNIAGQFGGAAGAADAQAN